VEHVTDYALLFTVAIFRPPCQALNTEMNAKKLYEAHKRSCNNRFDANGVLIEFRLSFDEWYSIWIESGHFNDRGCSSGKYVMGRINDLGHYEVGNVCIILHSENISFAASGSKNYFYGKPGTMLGKTGDQHGQFMGTTVGTEIRTGREIFMDGRKAIEAAGFCPGHVSKCILGQRKTHKGHTFRRIEK
jgi:hypothetical protein